MKNVPNMLSVLRILLTPLFVVLYVQDELVYTSLALGVFAAAAITDYFDGYIARTYNARSKMGTFLDPLADKILTFAGFGVLPYVSPEVFPVWPIVLIVLRDLWVTWMRLLADRRGITMQTRSIAKAKTAVQMVYLSIALLGGVFILADVPPSQLARMSYEVGFFTWGLYLVSAFTVYTGLEYIWVNFKLFKASGHVRI
jgi:CDP-diacylglycerol---glycerol-3-phosphate 3-phosphatidyltransferase